MEVEKLFKKVCTNAYLATRWERNRKTDTFEKTFQDYRRDDLYHWSKEAFERGEEYFYAEPVNPNLPYGKLKLCEPHYEYQLKRNLTIDEYDELIKKISI